MATGTLNLAALRANTIRGAIPVDDLAARAKINELLEADLAEFNRRLAEQRAFLSKDTVLTSMSFGRTSISSFVRNSEYGRPISRMGTTPHTVSFPVETFTDGLGWTDKYLRFASPAELMESYDAKREGYALNQLQLIREALFVDDNITVWDEFNNIDIDVKRLYNNDGTVPAPYQGTTFAGTHTHYLARAAALANSDVDGAITHVTHHGYTQDVRIFVNSSNKDAVTALSKFKAYIPVTLVATGGDTVKKLDVNAPSNNRAIGLWDNTYEVWVKDAITPANYILVADVGQPEKPLAYRQLPVASLQGLRFEGRNKINELVAEKVEAIEGFGVWNRGMAAILYIGGTSWVDAA